MKAVDLMDAQDFVKRFKNKECTDLVDAYVKALTAYEEMRDMPMVVTSHSTYHPRGRETVERAKQEVAKRQGALGAYLLKVLDEPGVKALMDTLPPHALKDMP